MKPQPPLVPADSGSRATLSRWILPESSTPVELATGEEDGSHTLSFFMTSTAGELRLGGKRMPRGSCEAGSLLIKEPYVGAKAVCFRGYTSVRLYLPQLLIAECYESAFKRSPSNEVILSRSRQLVDPVLHKLIRLLADIDEDGGIGGPAFTDGVSLAIISRLLSLDARTAPSAAPQKGVSPLAMWKLSRVKDYIEENLGRPIYHNELSNLVELSRMHFAAQFRSATGFSPCHFILRRKIARAQSLLQDTSMSVAEIACALGFTKQARFTVAFKSVVGQTPTRWRLLSR